MEPLAICFVWNKEDDRVVKKYIDYTTELLTRDLENHGKSIHRIVLIFYSLNVITSM